MLREGVTQSRLMQLLRYEPLTGLFTRRVDLGGAYKAGTIAGRDNGQGYIQITVDGCSYRAHRLAVLYMTGKWPAAEVDHINGNRSDNRWVNIRCVTGKENTHNQRTPHRNNTTGFLGVKRCRGKFSACIGVNGKRKHLGLFDSPEKAHEAYLAAKRTLHPSCTI